MKVLDFGLAKLTERHTFERVDTQDPETECLSDGLTESIINNLTRLPKLLVIARGPDALNKTVTSSYF